MDHEVNYTPGLKLRIYSKRQREGERGHSDE